MSDNYQATFAAPLTRAELEADNPYVPQFEFLQESDASLGVKVGPGYWNDLPYLANSGVKVYRATLSQTGTSSPTATVLVNTLGGTVVWTRSSAGSYLATLAGAFPDQTKNFASIIYGVNTSDAEIDGLIVSADASGPDSIVFLARDITSAFADLHCDNAAVEILVYP